MENAVDPSHTRYLHGETFRRKGIRRDVSYILKKVDHFEFEQCEWGIRKRRVFVDGEKEIGYLLVFPNILRHPGSLHFRVPIDDTHTQIYRVIRTETPQSLDGRSLPLEYVTYKDGKGEFHMENFPSQDAMAWEPQGPGHRARERAARRVGPGNHDLPKNAERADRDGRPGRRTDGAGARSSNQPAHRIRHQRVARRRGMSGMLRVVDVALAAHVYRHAKEGSLGREL